MERYTDNNGEKRGWKKTQTFETGYRVEDADGKAVRRDAKVLVMTEDGEPASTDMLESVANRLLSNGSAVPALALLRQVYEARRDELGDDDLKTLTARCSFGLALSRCGRSFEGLLQQRTAIEKMEELLDANDRALLEAKSDMTSVLLDLKRGEEAEETSRALLAALERVAPDDGKADELAAVVFNQLGSALRLQGRVDEAIESYERAIELLREKRNCDAQSLIYESTVGSSLLKMDRCEKALFHLQRAYDGLCASLGAEHDVTKEVGRSLDEARRRLGETEREG